MSTNVTDKTLVLEKNNTEITDKITEIWTDLAKDATYSETLNENNYSLENLQSSVMQMLNLSTTESKTELWANVVIDVLMCLALIADIKLTKSRAAVEAVVEMTEPAEAAMGHVVREVGTMFRSGDAVQQGRALLKMCQFIYAFYGVSSLKNIITAMAQNMSTWDKIRTVLEFLAWMAVIVLSDGLALIAKIACLGITLVNTITDITKLEKALN
jgi:hypothetical protein